MFGGLCWIRTNNARSSISGAAAYLGVRLQWPQPQPVPNLAVHQRSDSVVSANIAKPRRFAAVSRALWIHTCLSCAFVAAMNHNNIAVLVLREINHCSLRLQPNPSINRTLSAPVISSDISHLMSFK